MERRPSEYRFVDGKFIFFENKSAFLPEGIVPKDDIVK